MDKQFNSNFDLITSEIIFFFFLLFFIYEIIIRVAPGLPDEIHLEFFIYGNYRQTNDSSRECES